MKKIKVKINPLLLEKTTVRDTVTGTVFSHKGWAEIDMAVWERLKDATYKQGTQKVSVLIADEEKLDDSTTEDDKESVEEVVEDFFIAEEE
jgi:ribosomal protein S3|tara:strand:- start:4364 stop:4636 length:273 start_codon:yes stop_codon:yes gene_type:complete